MSARDGSYDIGPGFAERMRARRAELGISQSVLAGATQTRQEGTADKAYVSLLERELRSPSWTTVVSLATRLEVTPEWLARGEEDPVAVAALVVIAVARNDDDEIDIEMLDVAVDRLKLVCEARWPTLFREQAAEVV